MSPRIPLATVAVALLLAGAFLNGWLVDRPPQSPPSFLVPERVGAWSTAADERLNAELQSILQPSSYALRRYEASDRSPIHVYVAFYASHRNSVKAAHDPEACYPSAGWEEADHRSLELPVSSPEGSARLRATLLDMRRGGVNEMVLYWFQPAGRWPAGRLADELFYVYDATMGRPQYAFVRLVGVVPSDADRALVVADLEAFARELAWPVRAALETPTAATLGSAAPGPVGWLDHPGSGLR
jgi:EpsI family protein